MQCAMIERVSFYMRDDLSTARNLDVIDKETVHSVARSKDPPVTQETIIRGPSVLQNGVNDMVPHPLYGSEYAEIASNKRRTVETSAG